MSATDETLFETMVRVENKDIFIDLKKNRGGVYLKISERNGTGRNTVLMPASGIAKLRAVLDDVSKVNSKSKVMSKERKTRAAGDPSIVSRSVYVSGLTWDTTDEELQQHFAQAGTVTKAAIMRQRRGGNNRSSMGCGVVEFATEDDALNAVETLSESELKGRKIHCREDRDPATEMDSEPSENGKLTAAVSPASASAVTPGAASKVNTARTTRPNGAAKAGAASPSASAEKVADPCKIFVSGLDWNVDDEELRTHFSSVGHIVSAEVMHNKKGRSMGSGIVEFTDIAAVQAAVTRLSDSMIRARKIGVRQYYQ